MMALYQISITINDVIEQLADFIQDFVGNTPVVRAQVNRVPLPKPSAVVLTELMQQDLAVSAGEFLGDDDEIAIHAQKLISVQIDFYGAQAGDWCSAIRSVCRTEYAAGKFSNGISILYCDDGIQSPLISGEQQWVSRWTLTASFQYNPIINVPQQFADELSMNSVTQADS